MRDCAAPRPGAAVVVGGHCATPPCRRGARSRWPVRSLRCPDGAGPQSCAPGRARFPPAPSPLLAGRVCARIHRRRAPSSTFPGGPGAPPRIAQRTDRALVSSVVLPGVELMGSPRATTAGRAERAFLLCRRCSGDDARFGMKGARQGCTGVDVARRCLRPSSYVRDERKPLVRVRFRLPDTRLPGKMCTCVVCVSALFRSSKSLVFPCVALSGYGEIQT